MRCDLLTSAAILHAMSLPAAQPDTSRSAKRTRTKQIRGPLRAALNAMVWEGLSRKHAAAKAGMTDHGLYSAFLKPHVKQAYLAELDLLRLSERARSVFRLTELRDQDDNKMVAFNAAKELAGPSDGESSHANTQRVPGLVVQINTMGDTRLTQPAPVVIDNDGGSST